MALLGEGFLAMITYVWFISGMNSNMVRKSAFVGEGPLAMITDVRFLSSMNSK